MQLIKNIKKIEIVLFLYFINLIETNSRIYDKITKELSGLNGLLTSEIKVDKNLKVENKNIKKNTNAKTTTKTNANTIANTTTIPNLTNKINPKTYKNPTKNLTQKISAKKNLFTITSQIPKENINKYFFDFDNLIKSQETKNFFNNKIIKINNNKQLEMFLFFFEDLYPESLQKKINLQENEKNSQKLKKNQIKMSKINPSINNITNKNKNITKNPQKNLKTNGKKLFAEEDNKSLNDLNTDLLKKFLLGKKLKNLENAIIVIISKQEKFLGIFLGKYSLINFTSKDEKFIAKNFIKNFILDKIEYGIDELLENIDEILYNHIYVNLFHLVILLFCFSPLVIFFWFYLQRLLLLMGKDKKNEPRNYEDNIETIRIITKESLNKANRVHYDNTCLICLEDINGCCSKEKNEEIFVKNLIDGSAIDNTNDGNTNTDSFNGKFNCDYSCSYFQIELNPIGKNSTYKKNEDNSLIENTSGNKEISELSFLPTNFTHLNTYKNNTLEIIQEISYSPLQTNTFPIEEKLKKTAENFEAILNCHHKFHSKCIAMWMIRGDYCPICRSKIDIEVIKREKENKNVNLRQGNNFYENILLEDNLNDSMSMILVEN